MNEHETSIDSNVQGESRALKIALAIVVLLVVAELIGGIISNSLALLGDAGHMFVDALALGISLFAITLAGKPSTTTRTFGYHRAEIMAALLNGIILVLVAIYIFYEAYQRFLSPPEVKTTLMLVVASVGLCANLAGIFLLRKHSHRSLNVKAAFLHVLGDTISSIGVIIGGIIMAVTGWGIVDPIVAVLIGCIILWGAVRLVRESSDILLEAVPRDISVREIIEAIKEVPGINDIHDLHVWTITSGIVALSSHILIEDQMISRTGEIVETVNRILTDRFNITHTTLQLECERCEDCPSGFICNMQR